MLQRKNPKMFALGRLKPGEMNKAEAKYSLELERRKQAGEILWYAFEGIKLRLADRTTYTVDFFVLDQSGILEAHEFKGWAMADSLVKLKVAAEMYPFKFIMVKEVAKKDGGGYSFKQFSE